MSIQRRLTEDEKAELEGLNTAISGAIEARRNWLDAKMHETSRLQVGDAIYDVSRGVILGTVTGLYRYWAGRNDLLDDSMSCDYEYRVGGGWINNTSSQIGVRFGTLEDATQHAEWEASRLRALREASQ